VLASSGVGTGAAIVALATFLVIAPDRIPKLGTLALGGAGTAFLAIGLSERVDLDRGLPTAAAISQGDEMLVIAIAACVGVALAQTAIGLAVRFVERPRALMISRRNAWIGTGVALLIAIPIAFAAGVPGTVSDDWGHFKSRSSSADQTDRSQVLVDTSSSGRYQFWESAARAAKTDPLIGIGPGTFEFYWSQDPESFGFVRDAHSLYMENLAELGWIGFGLIVALVLATLGIGIARSISAPPAARIRIATATAAATAFAAGAALDWIWEIAALPALFMLLAAVLATDTEPDEVGSILARRVRPKRRPESQVRKYGPRIAAAAVALAAMLVVWFPLQGASDLRESQIDVAIGDLSAALAQAEDAAGAQPYAASPQLQKALVLEIQGKVAPAVAAAREATRNESANWRNWITLSRLEAKSGNAEASVLALRRARELNPRPLGGSA
ncbi:MAG TPA: O-antigen ligase family protein, partial [Polyangia bacterium]|nr:O-antigen ligase family protein [Polyangia bacterium]